MGLYSVPKEIRDQKPDKTIVKKINNHFYVYEFSSTKVKKQIDEISFKWVTKNTVGKCIDQITLEEGFVPNSNYISEQEVTILEYGSFSFLLQKTESILKLLKETFSARPFRTSLSLAENSQLTNAVALHHNKCILNSCNLCSHNLHSFRMT